MEVYDTRCIPVFPSYETNWPCAFIVTNDDNKAFFVTDDTAPEGFDGCCIFKDPFHIPAKNVTDTFTYYGEGQLFNKTFHNFTVNIGGYAGPFIYNFWDEKKDGVYVPAFFIFTGTNSTWSYMLFNNFETKKFNSAKQFKLPDSCLRADIKMCPDYNQTAPISPSSKVADHSHGHHGHGHHGHHHAKEVEREEL